MKPWFFIAVFVPALLGSACSESVDLTQASKREATTTTQQAGMCAEHGVPEALCTKCNPALITVFKARGDWCEEHSFPESFCPVCNPDTQFPDVGPVPAPVVDWCGGHGLPESKCTKCNSSLIADYQATGDWCEEHGFPESVCPVCNPQQAPGGAKEVGDWCLEHGLPESKCTKCNSGLLQQFQQAGDWCAEHGFPESVCPVCNPQEPPSGAEKAAIEARTVRFKSPDIEEAAGIRTVNAQRTQATAAIECTAQIAFDSDKIADVRALVPGVVRRIRAKLGAHVERGAILFELESTRVSETQGVLQTGLERVRTAQANVARQRSLRRSDIASARQVELAERELASAQAEASAAEATLRMAGAARAAPSGRYSLAAPIAGTIIRRPAVVGLLATESTSLATIGDTSIMWALCAVPEADASRIALGQKAHITVGGNTFAGEITWISAEVDRRTRTVTARAEIPNPKGQLRANQFARARIETGVPRTAVSVPRSTVQRVGEQSVVFVRTGQGIYEPRVVRLYGSGDVVQVEGSVHDGDAVVTTGAVLLRTEIMPGSIGAGCCEAEPPGGN